MPVSDNQDMWDSIAGDTPPSCYAKLQYPTSSAQLQLRNEILTHAHPSLILWWSFMGTYGQAGNDTYDSYLQGSRRQPEDQAALS
jgi:hypothetical protein